ncbi:unnamed protein product [Caenorhabditis auriculariae]|uniref:Uncharacterized protein n=1 Tax=Caenorhabditis auriculariae TaxID=2777116 RepID=A0A8S1HYH5_9PELO|nr:unnamed protein product [Caenorhabditis auriculariae]
MRSFFAIISVIFLVSANPRIGNFADGDSIAVSTKEFTAQPVVSTVTAAASSFKLTSCTFDVHRSSRVSWFYRSPHYSNPSASSFKLTSCTFDVHRSSRVSWFYRSPHYSNPSASSFKLTSCTFDVHRSSRVSWFYRSLHYRISSST